MDTVVSRLLQAALLCALVTDSALAQQAGPAAATDVTRRSIKAVGYQVGGGDTTVDLKPSGLVPSARGEAKVQARASVTTVEAKMEGLRSPTEQGAEFLAYVMWAVSPEGRAVNLGEIRPKENGEGELKTTTPLQSFSLFVTAEPYSAVRQPSELLVLENDVRKNTKGRLYVVENYQLMRRTQYQKLGNPLALTVDLKNVPMEVYQARNAVDIARTRGAEKYAPDIFSRAVGGLELTENALTKKQDKKQVISLARQAIQASEDARALTAERREEERIANERAAAAAKAKAEAEAKAAAEAAAAKARADQEAARQAELAAAREATLRAEAAARQAEAERQQAQLRADAAAKQAQLQAEAAKQQAEAQAREAAAREAQIRADADAAAREERIRAEAAAREAAAKSEAERARAAAEALRAQLLEQFNRILETKDTVRGLVITMADVLFDTGKYDLRSQTREALARLSGIVVSHPGLKLEVEGHTDSTGSDQLNQTLSEERAGAVRSYLITQGVAGDAITAKGLGKTSPVADNDTAAGRQKNRRVEMIVSGEVIGVQIGN